MDKRTQKWLAKEQGKILDNKVHYFCACFTHWATHEDMGTALKNLRKATGSGKNTVHVWLVPVDKSTPYEIQMYTPQIADAHLIATVKYAR